MIEKILNSNYKGKNYFLTTVEKITNGKIK